MEKREILKTKIEEINYDIIQEFKDNPNIRTILYTERLYSFMRKKDLTLLPTKIINVILSAVKDEQQKYIKEASLPGIIVETPVRQMSFEDIFQDWAENTRARFTVNFKSIKLDKDIKNRELFEAFIYLSNLNWQIINDVETGDVDLVPFIEAVKWNKNKQYIQFNMHKKTMESLLDMSKFLKLENDFVMNLKSAKTLSFIFWLSKFIPYNGTTISIQKFVEEMNLTSSYPSKIDEYLKRIRAEINSGNYAYGFNYSFENKNIKFQLYYKKEAIGKVEEIEDLEALKRQRALYHIYSVRELSPENKKKIENIYKALGYEKTSSLLKRKISKDLKNDVYIEALMNILKGVERNSGFVRRKKLQKIMKKNIGKIKKNSKQRTSYIIQVK